jgi:septal ring factor EnvC (AmiA/AmiB activator)
MSVVVGALCAAAMLLAGASVLEEGKKLDQVRVELEQRRTALKDLDNAERSLIDSLGELDESLAQLADDGDAARARLDGLRSELRTLEAKGAVDDRELASAQGRLQARMRALYVGGEGGTARALLGAEGFEELALTRRFLQKLAESDAKLVAEVARIEKRVRDQRERVRTTTVEAEMTARTIEEQRELIEATRAERRAAIARIATERSLTRRQAHELEARKEALALLVRKLVEDEERRPLTGSNQTARGILKGKLMWPVAGVLIRRFGVVVDQDSKAEIVSNGIELRADEGTPIAAVADGRVAHVGWMRGFGRVVILDHGDGHHTISAHTQKPTVARGDEVRRGQTIAFVGDTESTNGPKLYFELRENGRPLNPAPYLEK